MSTTAGPHMIRPATAEQRSQRVFAKRTLGRTVLPTESGTTLLTMYMDNTYTIDTHIYDTLHMCLSGCLVSELFHVCACGYTCIIFYIHVK